MKTREELLQYALSFSDVYQDAPFHDPNWQLVRAKENQKVFLWTYEKDGKLQINVKVKAEWRDFWRQLYPAVVPGYHLNKQHWNTIIMDGSIPDEEIMRMIADSYDLVTNTPSKKIYEAVRKIPYGKVATYGQVAEMAGDRKMARAVGNALHKNPDPETIPCYKVVNAKGELAKEFVFGGPGEQAKRLAEEGIYVENNRVNLEKYGMKNEDIS